MTNGKYDDLNHEIDELEQTMHDADQFRTLEEQVADMKRRGIEPNQGYKDVDQKEEDEDWGDETWKENGKWEPKTSKDLDEKARENWGDSDDKPNPPPIV
ncbi:hypothetical protein [Psychrobacter sp.]|uniref:hypothetical protein n=1 Tax=Psychrobacter sp. TaxID=56811 RepID=UPI00264832FD|nr:hypothetical protein [Psychrobacter sp.]MDN6276719.1 hypothetical protein [Psychrobacter sp.]MDN6308957.1 hypothetical protein [Psychrobacter sp.]